MFFFSLCAHWYLQVASFFSSESGIYETKRKPENLIIILLLGSQVPIQLLLVTFQIHLMFVLCTMPQVFSCVDRVVWGKIHLFHLSRSRSSLYFFFFVSFWNCWECRTGTWEDFKQYKRGTVRHSLSFLCPGSSHMTPLPETANATCALVSFSRESACVCVCACVHTHVCVLIRGPVSNLNFHQPGMGVVMHTLVQQHCVYLNKFANLTWETGSCSFNLHFLQINEWGWASFQMCEMHLCFLLCGLTI